MTSMTTSTTSDVAIFLDLDNISIGARDASLVFDVNLILEKVKEKTQGRIVLQRAYYDNQRQEHKVVRELTLAGFVTQPAIAVNSYYKNLADMQITVDAMETLIDGHQLSTYVLITGDRDFTPLINSLRKRGKRVIGIGVRHTASPSLVSACDEYFYYEDLVPEPPLSDAQLEKLVQTALTEVLGNNEAGSVQASVVKEKMMDLSSGLFNNQHYGETSFSKFLSRFTHLLSIERVETTTFVRRADVRPAPSDLYKTYRSALKKEKLRIVAAEERLPILKSIVATLQRKESYLWRSLINEVFQQRNRNGRQVSKNMVNAVLLVAREAQVVRTLKGSSLSTAPVLLAVNDDKAFQEAVLRCDAAYLNAIRKLPEPFDLRQAALALYDRPESAAYLERYVLPRLEQMQ